MDTRLYERVSDHFARGRFAAAIEELEDRLRETGVDSFRTLLGARFTNPPSQILAQANAFIASCGSAPPPRALYLEMNGFYINPDRWFFNFFGYEKDGTLDGDDEDWLADWQFESPEITLTGMETVQQDYERYGQRTDGRDERTERAEEVASLLVVSRFVQLVGQATRSGPLAAEIPLVATAHDFDILGVFRPASVTDKERTALDRTAGLGRETETTR